MNEKETANHKGNKQQKDILKDLLVYSKKLKQNDFKDHYLSGWSLFRANKRVSPT